MNYIAFLDKIRETVSDLSPGEMVICPDWKEIYGRTALESDEVPDFDDEIIIKAACWSVRLSMRGLYTRYLEDGWESAAGLLKGIVRAGEGGGRAPAASYKERLNEFGQGLFERLRAIRSEMAKERKVSAYMIFPDRTLYEICLRQPGSMTELREIHGIGEKRAAMTGTRILTAVYDYTGGKYTDVSAASPSADVPVSEARDPDMSEAVDRAPDIPASADPGQESDAPEGHDPEITASASHVAEGEPPWL